MAIVTISGSTFLASGCICPNPTRWSRSSAIPPVKDPANVYYCANLIGRSDIRAADSTPSEQRHWTGAGRNPTPTAHGGA
jgi:hypothetical protein